MKACFYFTSNGAPGEASASRQENIGRKLQGVFIVMQTPFLQTLEVDETSLCREVQFLIRCGVHGLVWPVHASECQALSYKERLKYAEVICEQASKRLPVVIGVTACNKFEAVEYARHAQDNRAAAVITLPPGETASTDPAMFAEYISAVAGSCSLPIFVQTAYPGQGSALSPPFLLELASRLPSLAYVKEERFGLGPLPWRISEYVRQSATGQGHITPMGGAGAVFLMNEMARGSGGTMPGAGFADVQVQIWNWFHSGKRAEARELFSKMLMMAALEMSTGYVLQKEILRRRGIFGTILMRNTRKPLLDQGDLEELDEIFQSLRPYLLL